MSRTTWQNFIPNMREFPSMCHLNDLKSTDRLAVLTAGSSSLNNQPGVRPVWVCSQLFPDRVNSMVDAYRISSWTRSPRTRRGRVANSPGVESLERRDVPAGSITAMFDGVPAQLMSVKFSQFTGKSPQVETFTLAASPAVSVLFLDAATDHQIKSVVVNLVGFGKKSVAPITLSNAVVSSFQIAYAADQTPSFLIIVAAKSKTANSITATFDGRSAPLIDATLTQPSPNGTVKVGMTLAASPVSTVLSHDAVSGKVVKKFQLNFMKQGSHPTGSIALTNATVTSFQNSGGIGKSNTNLVTVIG